MDATNSVEREETEDGHDPEPSASATLSNPTYATSVNADDDSAPAHRAKFRQLYIDDVELPVREALHGKLTSLFFFKSGFSPVIYFL